MAGVAASDRPARSNPAAQQSAAAIQAAAIFGPLMESPSPSPSFCVTVPAATMENSASDAVENAAHPRVVRPLPIHAPASGAALEALVDRRHLPGQPVDGELALTSVGERVAPAAARDRGDDPFGLQRAHHFGELRLALGCAHEIAAIDVAAAQHPLVAREDGAFLHRR